MRKLLMCFLLFLIFYYIDQFQSAKVSFKVPKMKIQRVTLEKLAVLHEIAKKLQLRKKN